MLKMKEVHASDLHIKVGSAPIVRVASKLHQVNSPALTAEDTAQLLLPIVPEAMRSVLDAQGSLDFSHHEAEGERFRCSVFRAGGGYHAAIRRVSPTDSHVRGASSAAGLRKIHLRGPRGNDCCVRHHRQRKILHAGGDDRLRQPPSAVQHHHDRRPGGIRLPAEDVLHQPARDRHRRARFRRRPAQRRAPGSRRDDDRRAARSRNRAGRHSGRRNRAPGVRHAAHGRHHAGFQPHVGVLPCQGARIHSLQPGRQPAGHRRAAAAALRFATACSACRPPRCC